MSLGKRLGLISLVLCVVAVAAVALLRQPAGPGAGTNAWGSGWESAATESRRTKRPVLVNFTGSDWCSWCMRLHEEVFATQEFATWATGHVVLLTADFPRRSQLPAEQAAENERLARQYVIEGFPTIVLLDADGAELGRLGYEPGGPKPWIAKVESLLAAAAKR